MLILSFHVWLKLIHSALRLHLFINICFYVIRSNAKEPKRTFQTSLQITITSISHWDFHSWSHLIQTVLSVRLRVHFNLHHHRVRSSYMAEHFGEVFCLWSTSPVRKTLQTALSVVFFKHPTLALAHFPQAFCFLSVCGSGLPAPI